MATGRLRDDADTSRALARWAATRWPDRPGIDVVGLERPAAGWSNETVLVTFAWDGGTADVAVRLPSLVPSYPDYDLGAQARVHEVLDAAGIPVPHPSTYEPDERWLGAPFLVMPRVAGRPAGEAPALDPWITGSPLATQTRLHEEYVDLLAAVHRVDPSPLTGVLRGDGDPLAVEVAWWREYADWAADGDAAVGLVAALDWCRDTVPGTAPPGSLCWGDARLGNVMFDEQRHVTSVLDWELASIGPGEMDLAWYLALDELVERFSKQRVPGFLDREAVIARYEERLGRPVVDLEWHEVFALVRSTTINDRQARIAAATGTAYPGVAGDDNPVLRYVARRIERFGREN